MNTLLDTLWYFCYITVELVVLFILITALVEIILMYIPQEKISKKIEKAGFFGNVIAAGFGALTPFCACSTIPMTVGFLNAGVPFGATMSFLIASPLLNPIIIAMLGALVGVKAMLVYVAIAFICSVFFGWGLQKVDAEKYVNNVRLKPQSCCSAEEKPVEPKKLPWGQKIAIALRAGWDTLRPILRYLIIGVALGAVIYGYMPSDWVLKIAGPGQSLCRTRCGNYRCSIVYPCRNRNPHRSSPYGKGHEHRSCYRTCNRWRRHGNPRNVYARKYLQEETCRHDCHSNLPHCRYLRLPI